MARTNRTGQTLPMDGKYTKAIDKMQQYPMDKVIDWWRRMFMGWVEVNGDSVTFFHPRMDGAKAAYSRSAW